jgi:hypothetical protein
VELAFVGVAGLFAGVELLFELFGVLGIQCGSQLGECLGEVVQGLQDVAAVLEQDLTPESGLARRDSGGVAPAAAGQREMLARRGRGQGRGDHVRRVADRGDGGVVSVRCYAEHLSTQRAPKGFDLQRDVLRGAIVRRNHRDAIDEQVFPAVPSAAFLAARHRGAYATCACSRTPSARATLSTVAKLGLPSSLSAL